MAQRWVYLMTQRPPMPGAMPHDGLREVHEPRRGVAEMIGHRVYAELVYDRPLSAAEVAQYELFPHMEGQPKVV